MPDGVIYKPCGNRRVTTCPGCAETYRRDAYHLIRAGLIGGKGITPAVATHPALFVTFTAPSFGPVHSRPVRQHTCADKTRCTCQPQPCHARRDAGTCEHGRPAACFTRHRRDDPQLGQPLCPDCYDYPAHVVWNNQAGELWRRTKQAIERHLGQLARRRGAPDPRSCGDGKYRRPSRSASRTARPPNTRPAARSTSTPCSASTATTPPTRTGCCPRHPASPSPTWTTPPGGPPAPSATAPRRTPPSPAAGPSPGAPRSTSGVITLHGTGTVTDLAVASYLAKYSTKGTEPAGHASARITADTLDLYASPDGTHPERLIDACWRHRRCTPATSACAAGPTCSASAATS